MSSPSVAASKYQSRAARASATPLAPRSLVHQRTAERPTTYRTAATATTPMANGRISVQSPKAIGPPDGQGAASSKPTRIAAAHATSADQAR